MTGVFDTVTALQDAVQLQIPRQLLHSLDTGVTVVTVPGHGIGLFWKPEAIAKLMSDNDIQCRWQLAERLEKVYGIGQATVYRAFTEDWKGKASSVVLAAISELFRTPLNKLVADPSEERNCA